MPDGGLDIRPKARDVARLATMPCPTGSLSRAKMMGIVLVACLRAVITGVLLATMRSGAALTNSVT